MGQIRLIYLSLPTSISTGKLFMRVYGNNLCYDMYIGLFNLFIFVSSPGLGMKIDYNLYNLYENSLYIGTDIITENNVSA